jgi:hypothetical protein
VEVQPLGISFEGVTAIRSFLEDWLGSYVEYESGQEKGKDMGNGVVFVWLTSTLAQLAAQAGSTNDGPSLCCGRRAW